MAAHYSLIQLILALFGGLVLGYMFGAFTHRKEDERIMRIQSDTIQSQVNTIENQSQTLSLLEEQVKERDTFIDTMIPILNNLATQAEEGGDETFVEPI